MAKATFYVSNIVPYEVLAPQGQIIATVVLAPQQNLAEEKQRGKVEVHVMSKAELAEYELGKSYVIDVSPAPAA